MSTADPLKKCPRGCLFEAKHSYCPWHGEPLKSLVGETIGEDFVIERVVSGVGGFGVVYYAKNFVNFAAAVKVLRPNACYDKGAVKDFLDEAERTFNLLKDCPNTARVMAVGRKPFPFICMTYVSGGSLSNRLERAREKVAGARSEAAKKRVRSQEIPWQDCYEMLVGIARALEYAHDQKMVHRDLKPHNVLIDRDANGKELAKVVDWGIAIARRATNQAETEDLDTVAVPTLTLTSEIPDGMERRASQITVKYAPPEFFRYVLQRERPEERNLKEVFDPRTDIYQFGLVAFELITGEFPFPPAEAGSTAAERFEHWRQQHCRVNGAAPARLTKYRSDFSRPARLRSLKRNRMAKIVARCLEKDPRRRYKNGEELLKNLTQEPVWKEVVGFAAAALILVAVALYFFRDANNYGAAIGNFWSAWKDPGGWPKCENGPPQIFAETVKPALVIDGNVERTREVQRIWIRTPDDLRATRWGCPVVYATPPLGMAAGGELKVAVQRWQTNVIPQAGDEMIELASPLALTAAQGELPIVWTDGDSVLIDLSALTDVSPEWTSGAEARSFVYTVDVTRADGARNSGFFEIRIDPSMPAVALVGVKLVAPGNRLDDKEYDLDMETFAGGTARLFVPEDYKDLEIELAVKDEGGDGLGGGYDVQATALQQPLPSRRDGKRLFLTLPVNVGGLRVPTPQGTPLKLSLCAIDRAGNTAKDCPEKALELVLDSGLDLRIDASVQDGLLTGGLVPISIREDERSLAAVYAQSGEGTLVSAMTPEGKSLEIPTEVIAQGGSTGAEGVQIYGLERGLLYPGLTRSPSDDDLRAFAGQLSPKGRLKLPNKDVTRSDFEIRVPAFGRTLREAGEALVWRTNSLERFPTALVLEAKNRPDIKPASTLWLRAGDVVQNGAEFALERPAAGVARREELEVAVSSFVGKSLRVPVIVEYDPALPFVDEFRVKQVGAAERRVFATAGEIFETRATDGVPIRCVVAKRDLGTAEGTLKITRLTDSSLGAITISAQANSDGQLDFTVPPEFGEGIYALTFGFVDALENEESRGPYYLIVHGAAPSLRINAIECTASSQPIPACYLTVDAEDPSGLQSLSIKVDDDAPIVLGPADLEKLDKESTVGDDGRGRVQAIDRIPNTRFVKDITVRIDNLVGAGRDAKVEVAVADSSSVGNGTTSCERVFRCGASEQPPFVKGWRGLDWIYVKIADGRDFYISRTEIPRWKWDGKDAPESEIERLPKVGVSPSDVRAWITDKMPGTYLPTDREWKAVVRSASGSTQWIAEGKVFETPNRKVRDFDVVETELQKAIVSKFCTDEEVKKLFTAYKNERSLIPVDYVPSGLAEFKDKFNVELFYGVLHPLGNAREIVVVEGSADATKYKSFGGNRGVPLEDCIDTKYRDELAGEDDAGLDQGFRLVVYYQDLPVSLSGLADARRANGDFQQFKERSVSE